ncbi:MAG TPA: hypothetical protein VF522_17780 [Ramlibacter sp.]|uniref:hypothetical protein n=1 Tax=Ramlibacter sp. TaxID=1917967 RepID=UPI002ED6AAA4
MFGWLKGKQVAEPPPERSTSLPGEVIWRDGTTLPIPDWERHDWPDATDGAKLHAYANGLAAAWVDALGTQLHSGYRRDESASFMLLSALEPRPARALLDYLERSLRRVLTTLPGIASDEGHGKTVVLVLDDEDSYYQYIAHYGSGSDEPEAFSGGMFIDWGYGHFVFAQGPFEQMEPVVVHELTHCLVRHLPIPAWLNEGLAVNTERRFSPSRPRYTAAELAFLFGRFWNADTIQEFWTGKSFLRADDGQPLSYELARLLVQLLDKDYDRLARFCGQALREDAGEAAARAVLGAGLEELAGIVLGPGEWRPQPVLWSSGTEKGQFRPEGDARMTACRATPNP